MEIFAYCLTLRCFALCLVLTTETDVAGRAFQFPIDIFSGWDFDTAQ